MPKCDFNKIALHKKKTYKKLLIRTRMECCFSLQNFNVYVDDNNFNHEHCQRFLSLLISDTLLAGFEPTQRESLVLLNDSLIKTFI